MRSMDVINPYKSKYVMFGVVLPDIQALIKSVTKMFHNC